MTTSLPIGTFEGRHSDRDLNAYGLAEQAFAQSSIPLLDRLEAFPRFTTKRSLARFLAKERLYQQVLPVAGVIIECGVFNGAGLFTWAQLSNIFEPSNHTRRIIGFDTFDGFPSVNESADNRGVLTSKVGDLRGSPRSEIEQSVRKLDAERHLAHIPSIELVQGDFMRTAPEFLERQPQTLVSLLYLDFDLYEPTKLALELFLPRMPRGAVVAFDELNCASFPGETQAFLEVMGATKPRLNRFPFDPWISYVTLGE